MTTEELFKAFGTKNAVMGITGQSRNTVNHWVYVGVPWRHWPALKAAAARLGIPGITDEALAGTKENLPKRPRRRGKRAVGCCKRAA